MTPRLALRDGFKLWLDEVTGGTKIPIGRRLHPFATSTRSTARMVAPLDDVAAGRGVGAADPGQALADLTSAGLVERFAGTQALTDLGRVVLARWKELGIANTDNADEAARCAALVRAGVTNGVALYVGFHDFWRELVDLAPADYWFQDIYTLGLPCYLDQSDSNGFNPFYVLVAANRGHIGIGHEWREWADSDEVVGPQLTKLLDRVKDSFRTGGFLAFCRGMEAYRLATTDPELLPGVLKEWGIANE